MSVNHQDKQYKKLGGSQGKMWHVNLSTTYGQK